MANDEFVMVPIIDILNNVTGSCDFGYVSDYAGETEDDQRTAFWLDVIAEKASDSGMGHLVESILENGFVDSAIGWNAGCYINEGHHRLVAAILLCMDEIPTLPYGRSSMQFDICAHDGCCKTDDPYPLEVFIS